MNQSPGGIILPSDLIEPEAPCKPVKSDWNYSKCDYRYFTRNDEAFRRDALERIYIIVDPGGGQIRLRDDQFNKDEMLELIDKLAIAIIGGVPSEVEEFTC